MALEELHFEHEVAGAAAEGDRHWLHVGYVSSGDLEILAEGRPEHPSLLKTHVTTSIVGYGAIWRAVIGDFARRRGFGGYEIWINDNAATPAVAKLRLEQLYQESRTKR